MIVMIVMIAVVVMMTARPTGQPEWRGVDT